MKFRYLIVIVLIIGILIPKPTHAFIGTGVFDFFESALNGIEEFAGPIAKWLVSLFFIYVGSTLFLGLSVWGLETAMDPNFLNLNEAGRPMVEVGWQFTSNLANIFIIIALLVIAFSTILKIETFEVKKTLPRLIVVALLVNFSLLFVKMAVDVSNVVYNTFFSGNESLPTAITQNLRMGMLTMISGFALMIGAYAAQFLLPFIAPVAQFTIVTYGIGEFLPQLVTSIFQIASSLLIGGVFFVVAFRFIVRIFMIQILAVVSPLAFVALTFKQTKSWFQKWWKILAGWLFWGVAFFFFLLLGLKATNAILDVTNLRGYSQWEFSDWLTISPFFVYYLFLTIYLVIANEITKKIKPEFSDFLEKAAIGAGGFIMGRGLKPLWGRVKSGMDRFASSRSKQTEQLTQRISEAKGLGKAAAVLGSVATPGAATAGVIRWTRRLQGTSPEASRGKELDSEIEKIEKKFGDNIDGAKAYYGNRIPTMSQNKQAAIMLYAAKKKGAEGLAKFGKEEDIKKSMVYLSSTAPQKLMDVAKFKPDLLADEGLFKENVYKTLVPKGKEDDDVRNYVNEENIPEDEAIKKVAIERAVKKLKDEDAVNLTKEQVSNETVKEAVAKFKSPSFIFEVNKFHPNFMTDIQKKAVSVGLDKIAVTNDKLLKELHTERGILMNKWKDIIEKTDAIKNFTQEQKDRIIAQADKYDSKDDCRQRVIEQKREAANRRATIAAVRARGPAVPGVGPVPGGPGGPGIGPQRPQGRPGVGGNP